MIPSPLQRFKLLVAKLLDERNLATSKATKVTTFIIVGLILISAFQVVLDSIPGALRFSRLFQVANLTCTTVFTLELILRVWTADLLDDRFVGFKGRIAYLLTPYAVIDVVAVIPALVGIFLPGTSWSSLKVLRILRLLKLARFLKSFNFIIEATRKKKSELSISMQILLLLTFILSVLLFQVENAAQPDEFSSIGQAMLWSMSQYIGDIGGYADFQPVTTLGKLLASGVGILSIALFAVPSGIIASGFVEEMDEEKKRNEVSRHVELIEASFSEKPVAAMGRLPLQARKRTLPFLQSKLELTPEEIMQAIRSSRQLRLKWEKSSPELKVSDLTVIEYFNLNRPYGFEYIPAKTNIHVINPQGRGERGISHFGYSLGKAGGHHVVSNEVFAGSEILPQIKYNLTKNPDFAKDTVPDIPGVPEFLQDIQTGIEKETDWIVVLRSSASHRKAQFHVTFGGEKGDSSVSAVANPTVSSEALANLESFIQRFKEAMRPLGHAVGTHEDFVSTSPNLLHNYLHRHTGANVISIFISVELLSATSKDYYAALAALTPCLKALESNVQS